MDWIGSEYGFFYVYIDRFAFGSRLASGAGCDNRKRLGDFGDWGRAADCPDADAVAYGPRAGDGNELAGRDGECHIRKLAKLATGGTQPKAIDIARSFWFADSASGRVACQSGQRSDLGIFVCGVFGRYDRSCGVEKTDSARSILSPE